MKTTSAIAVAIVLAGTARAATVTFSPSNSPPLGGAIIISNLVGHVGYDGTGSDPGPQSNVDDPKYVANDQPVQGQTFTTGTNPNGYKLTSVSLRHVSYSTFILVPGLNYTIRITRPLSATTLTVIASETAEVSEDGSNCDTCNFPSFGNQYTHVTGTGRYITFTFDTPVPLAPNTVYGFDVGAADANGGDIGHYWETDGRDSTPPPHGATWTPMDPYPGGNAYNSGLSNGRGDNTMTNKAGDRVFVVALTLGNTITPPRFTLQPSNAVFYTGTMARLFARAAGDTNLVYQWRRDGTNLSNSIKYSGALSATLSVSNVSAGDAGSYSLVVTNIAGAITSAPPATLTTVPAPVPGSSYAYAVFTNKALSYWRLSEAVDPSTNPPTHDFIGGGIGMFGTASLIANGPRPSDSLPGFESGNTAVQVTAPTDDSWVTVPPLYLNTNTVTFTAWIYPIGPQADFAALLWTDSGGTRAGMAFGDSFAHSSGQLTYTWNRTALRALPSGLTIPSNKWSFVALVVTPTNGSLYLGSGGPLASSVNSTPHMTELWNGPWRFGYDPYWSPPPQYVFNGVIDEVAVFKRSLSFDEVNTLYSIGRGIVQPVPPSFTGDAPASQQLYAGRTARFQALATGSSPLVYRWQKNGVNLSDSGNISGAQTTTLTISNVAAGDAAGYTLVVTNSVGAITSTPPATLSIVAPSGKGYEAAIRAANPVAYWRLNETGDPMTNAPAFDFWGGFVGRYESNALNGFNLISGPRPADFPELEANNTALEMDTLGALHSYAWATVPALNLNTNTVTITLWLKPAVDPVQDFAGLFYSRDGSASGNGAGLRYSTNSQLGYTWNLGALETSQFASGLTPPVGLWSFAALVIEPTKATLYLYNANGQASATNVIPHVAEPWDGTAFIGYDGGYYNADFPGDIDEVAVFNYAFTPSQVLNLYNAALGAAPSVTLTIQYVGPNVILSWPQGILLEAGSVSGPWVTNNAATPPQYIVTPTGGAKFYRVRVQ